MQHGIYGANPKLSLSLVDLGRQTVLFVTTLRLKLR